MNNKQAHKICTFAANELEETLVRLNEAGRAIKALNNVLIEINIQEGSDEGGFFHLKTHEKYSIQGAIKLLGDLTTYETYRIAERFGLENPR